MIDPSTKDILSHALSGENINAIFFADQTDVFNYDEETGIDPANPGLYPLIFETIANRANFTWKTNGFGLINDKNRSVTNTEMLVWGTENYDIFVGDWDVTTNRMNLDISFTSQVFDNNLIMVRNVIPTENKNHAWLLNWLYPFHFKVWIMLLVTILLSCFVFQFLEFVGKVRVEDHRSFKKWTLDNLYMSCINFTQNFSHEPSTLAGQIFSVSFAFWAMLIGAAYTANLASMLVRIPEPAFTLNSIQDAINNKMPICMDLQTGILEYMERKYPEALPLFVGRETREMMYNSLNNGECELLLDYEDDFNIKKTKVEFNPDCYLTWEGNAVNKISQSFVTKMDPGNKCSLLVQSK